MANYPKPLVFLFPLIINNFGWFWGTPWLNLISLQANGISVVVQVHCIEDLQRPWHSKSLGRPRSIDLFQGHFTGKWMVFGVYLQHTHIHILYIYTYCTYLCVHVYYTYIYMHYIVGGAGFPCPSKQLC